MFFGTFYRLVKNQVFGKTDAPNPALAIDSTSKICRNEVILPLGSHPSTVVGFGSGTFRCDAEKHGEIKVKSDE